MAKPYVFRRPWSRDAFLARRRHIPRWPEPGAQQQIIPSASPYVVGATHPYVFRPPWRRLVRNISWSAAPTQVWTADTAFFTISGQDVPGFEAGFGSFVLAGQDAFFVHTGALAFGSFLLSGQAATFTASFLADFASFLLSGQAAIPLLHMHNVVAWEGSAEMEFVSTTTFIAMIEDGDALLGTAAEIHLRSL